MPWDVRYNGNPVKKGAYLLGLYRTSLQISLSAGRALTTTSMPPHTVAPCPCMLAPHILEVSLRMVKG